MSSSSTSPSARKGTLHKSPVAKALHRLSDLADRAHVVVELALCHGSVIAVAYELDQSLGRVARPNDIAIHLIEAVSSELRLTLDWLEDDVARFLADGLATHGLQPGEFGPGVLLSMNTSANVLATKLGLLDTALPADATDERDAEYLLGKISVDSPEQIDRIYARLFPGRWLGPAARELVARVFHARAALRS